MKPVYGIITFALTVLMITGTAFAHPLDMYGYGARAVAMGGAYTAVADDYSALYYNIGGLSQIEGNSLTAGFMYAKPFFDLDLDPADGVSRKQAKALHRLEKDQIEVEDVNGYFFGVAVKPHRLLAVGLGAYLPEGLVVRLNPLDAHVPTFFLHEHRSQRVVTMIGGSLRIVPSLSVGAGIRLFLKTKGKFTMPLEMTNDNLNLNQGERGDEPFDVDAELKLDFPLTTYPFFGIHYQPTEDLRFGLSYQYFYTLDIEVALDMDVALSNYTIDLKDIDKIAPGLMPIKTMVEVNIPELGDTPLRVPVELSGLEGEVTLNASIPLDALITISDLWKPQSVNFGVAYDPIDALTLSFDAVWYNWSAFPSPDLKLKIDDINLNLQTLPASIRGRIKSLAIPVLGTIGPLPPVSLNIPGLDATITLPVDIADVTPVSTHDIIVPRLGMEYRFPTIQSFWWTGDLDLACRWGYTYSPSPFEADRGESNIIDSDTHQFSAGMGAEFNKLFSLDFYGQYQYFTPIKVNKELIDPDMPFQSYKASGHILAGGVSATVNW